MSEFRIVKSTKMDKEEIKQYVEIMNAACDEYLKDHPEEVENLKGHN